MATYLNEVGIFECLVVEPEAGWFGESKEKQTPFLRLPLKVNDGGSNHGHVITATIWLSDKAFDKNIARLKEVFGFDGDLESLHSGRQTLAGLPCQIVTESETYEGKERIKVKFINVAGGGAAKKMDDAKVESLIKKFSSRGKAIAKSVQAVVPVASVVPKSTTTEPVESDDDVPF